MCQKHTRKSRYGVCLSGPVKLPVICCFLEEYDYYRVQKSAQLAVLASDFVIAQVLCVTQILCGRTLHAVSTFGPSAASILEQQLQKI